MSANQRTIIVGDVHGCLQELTKLLGAVVWQASDRLIFVGDLVAKGPDSAGVVALARENAAACVLGNHEAHCLAWWRGQRGEAGPPPLREDHRRVCRSLLEMDWRWLEQLPLHLTIEEQDTLVVHAAVASGVDLDAQRPEDLLTGRSLCADGRLSSRIEDGVPWASCWSGPQHVVFGHDAMRGLQQYPYATGIDTGCVYGGRLTAYLLPEKRLVSIAAQRQWAATT